MRGEEGASVQTWRVGGGDSSVAPTECSASVHLQHASVIALPC